MAAYQSGSSTLPLVSRTRAIWGHFSAIICADVGGLFSSPRRMSAFSPPDGAVNALVWSLIFFAAVWIASANSVKLTAGASVSNATVLGLLTSFLCVAPTGRSTEALSAVRTGSISKVCVVASCFKSEANPCHWAGYISSSTAQ